MNLHPLKPILFIWTISIFLNACAPSKSSTGNTKSSTTKENKKKNTPKTSKGNYNPSRTLKNDLLHTKLELKFDWAKQHVLGTATLRFKPYFYPQNTLVLDAKGMDIHQIVMEGESQPIPFTYDKRNITIQLPKTYTRTDTFSIQLNYTAKPNELKSEGSAAITDDRGLYFINPDGKIKDKPTQLWTQGETESSSCWFPTIDSPNEKTTQEMYITIDSAYTVLTNGEFIYSHANTDGTKTDYWKMDLPHAPYLFMMAIGEFKVIKDQWRDKEVNYYVEPKYEKYAKAIFGNTPEMLEFFSTKLGYDYAWNKYSQVVVRDFVSGAMENTTATIFMEALQCDDRKLLDENWDGIIAHELFHHWFGDLVTCESWSNLPLNESFANYSEYLWAEYKYGKDEADYLDVKEEEEYLDEAIEKIEPLIRYNYTDKEDMFDRHSYNKGGRVLHMLRNYVGDEAFFESLKRYLTKKQFQTAEIHDLRLAFEEVTGEDLNWFFNQWFLSPGHPELKVAHKYSDGFLTISIMQTQDTLRQPIYRLPLTIDVWTNNKKTRHNIIVSKYKQNFKIPMSSSPQNVLVDAEFQLLGKIFHTKSDAELIFQYNNSERYRARAVALEKLFAPKENTNSSNPFADSVKLDLLTKALKDSFWVIRETALLQFSKYPIPNAADFIKKVEQLAITDPKPIVRSRAISLIASYDKDRFVPVYELGLEEKPYSIVSASLRAYLKTSKDDKAKQIERFENAEDDETIMVLANHFLFVKDSSRYDWYKKQLDVLTGKYLYYFIGYYGEYIKTMTGKEREDGKKTMEDLALNHRHEWIRKMAKKYSKEIN